MVFHFSQSQLVVIYTAICFHFLLAKIANAGSQRQYTLVDTLRQGELGTSWHLAGCGSYEVCQMASSSWASLSWEEVQKVMAGKSGSCSLFVTEPSGL